ncbi:hypothetical protein F5Y05DRAFT_205485 [Hypoxylon sp. FL0543]|nr:hypothetical protein F5Y05DRAFT_205485 [Hypoxylon sp. FL0543]
MMAAAFTSTAVLNAANPHPRFGYFHGPVPNQNTTGWVPPEQQSRIDAGKGLLGVTSAMNAKSPNQRVVVSKCNGGICMTESAPGSGIMCGIVFEDSASFWRHQRDFHVGAVEAPRPTMISANENAAGDLAFRKFVLTRGWRDAVFAHEPGYGPRSLSVSKIGPIADQLETFARENPEFAALWGSSFHRRGAKTPRLNQKRRLRRGAPTVVQESESDEDDDIPGDGTGWQPLKPKPRTEPVAPNLRIKLSSTTSRSASYGGSSTARNVPHFPDPPTAMYPETTVKPRNPRLSLSKPLAEPQLPTETNLLDAFHPSSTNDERGLKNKELRSRESSPLSCISYTSINPPIDLSIGSRDEPAGEEAEAQVESLSERPVEEPGETSEGESGQEIIKEEPRDEDDQTREIKQETVSERSERSGDSGDDKVDQEGVSEQSGDNSNSWVAGVDGKIEEPLENIQDNSGPSPSTATQPPTNPAGLSNILHPVPNPVPRKTRGREQIKEEQSDTEQPDPKKRKPLPQARLRCKRRNRKASGSRIKEECTCPFSQ